MPSIQKSIEVDVPVELAYDQWTQFEEFPHFMEGVTHVRRLDQDRLRWVANVGGQEAMWEAQIIEQTPPQRIAWTSVEGKENSGIVTFDRMGPEASRVSVELVWDSEGLMETLGGYLGADDRRVEGDLERFKELVETRAGRNDIPLDAGDPGVADRNVV